MASSVLQQTLRGLCKDLWCYAVFWKLKQQSRKVLTWEDAFYEQSKTQDHLKSLLDPAAGNTMMPSVELFNAKDPIGLSVSKMSYHIYSVGEGIIGRVAFTNKHQWIFSSSDKGAPTNEVLSSKRNIRTQPDKYPAGWDHQFAAGIKTIAVIAVPQGVLQLGSTQTVLEDLKLVGHAKALFGTLQNVPGAFLSDLMTEVQNGGVHTLYSMSAPTSQLHQAHSSAVGVTNAARMGASSMAVTINSAGTFGSTIHHSGVGRLPLLLSPHLQQQPLQVVQGTALQQLPMLYKPGGNFCQPSISSVNNTNVWSQPVGVDALRTAAQTGIINKLSLGGNGHTARTGIMENLSLSTGQPMRAMVPPQSGIISKLSLSCGQTTKDVALPQTGTASYSHSMKASNSTQMGTGSRSHLTKTTDSTKTGIISKFSLTNDHTMAHGAEICSAILPSSVTTTNCSSMATRAMRVSVHMNSSVVVTPSIKVSTSRSVVGDNQILDSESVGDSKLPFIFSRHVVGVPLVNVPQMLNKRDCIEVPERLCGRYTVDSLRVGNEEAVTGILDTEHSVRSISPGLGKISGDRHPNLLLDHRLCTADDECLADIQNQESLTGLHINQISPESLNKTYSAKIPDISGGLLSSERVQHLANHNEQLTSDNVLAISCQHSLEFQHTEDHYQNDCSRPFNDGVQSSLAMQKSSEAVYLESGSQGDENYQMLCDSLMQKSVVGSSEIANVPNVSLPVNSKSNCDIVGSGIFKFPHEALQPCSELLPGEIEKSDRNDQKDSLMVLRGLDETFFSEDDFLEDWHSMKVHAHGADSSVNNDAWGTAAYTHSAFSLDDFDEFLASLTKEKETNDFTPEQKTDSRQMFSNRTLGNSMQDRNLSAIGKGEVTNNIDCDYIPKRKLNCKSHSPMYVDGSKVTGNQSVMKESVPCKQIYNFEDRFLTDLSTKPQTVEEANQVMQHAQSLNCQKIEAPYPKASNQKRKRGHSGDDRIVQQKSRQKIEKCVGELRNVIPDGGNYDIDILLEKTVKYINHLQMALQESGKQIKNEKLKVDGDGGGDGQFGSDGTAINASWVLELQQKGGSCPVIVEDLAQPRQMLVEVVCERPGMVMDIEKTFQKLGLITMKSVMETRNDKIWARFQVEAVHDIHRLQVLWSVMQLLEPSS